MSETKSLDEILGELDCAGRRPKLKDGKPVTIWLLAEDKARYDELQKRTARKFLPKLREIVLAAIETAESQMGKAG